MVQSSACGICLEHYIDEHYPVSLACGHIFCWQCIQQIINTTNSSNICPIDRQPFEVNDVRRIYNEGDEETPEEKLQSVTDYLARVKRHNNELETRNQLLLERENELGQALTASENRNRQLLSDHETQRNKQQEALNTLSAKHDNAQQRMAQLELENQGLRNELETAKTERLSQLTASMSTILRTAMTDIEQVVTQQTGTEFQLGAVREQPISTDVIQQRQTGKVIGFGHYVNNRFGAGNKVNQRSPIKLDLFGTVTYAHPGNETLLINENGKLLKVTRDGLTELHMNISACFVTGVREYFAIDSHQHLWSWGNGSYGKLGHGDNVTRSEPKLIEAFRHKEIKHVSSNNLFTACVTTSGKVYFWGDLSKIGMSNASYPQLIQQQSRALQVACGSDHALILQRDGVVYAIGDNSLGQCGVGDTHGRDVFSKINVLDGKNVTKIACGWSCSAALTCSGQIYVWGGSICGVEEEPTTRPVLILLADVIDIALTSRHILALDRKSRVYAWGLNNYGQCGVNSTNNWINTPTFVTNLDFQT